MYAPQKSFVNAGAQVWASAAAYVRLVTLTKARPTHKHSQHSHFFSPYRCMVDGCFFAELSLEVGFLKHEHTPWNLHFVRKLYTCCAISRMDEDPGTTPMPTLRQKKEQLVNAFSKDLWLTWDLCGGEYTDFFAGIGQTMEDHFNRERESSSSLSDSESSDSSKLSKSSSISNSSSNGSKKTNNKFKKKYLKKKDKKPKKISKQTSPKKKKHPSAEEECPDPWRRHLGRLLSEPQEQKNRIPRKHTSRIMSNARMITIRV